MSYMSEIHYDVACERGQRMAEQAHAPRVDQRSLRAAAIIAAGDITQVRPNVYHIRDRAGSGREHVVTAHTCTCEDRSRTGLACKHMIALANWSSRTESCCPTCGSATEVQGYHVGGCGLVYFRVCRGNREHRAIRV